jgi:hypothetical protein
MIPAFRFVCVFLPVWEADRDVAYSAVDLHAVNDRSTRFWAAEG